MTAPVNIKLSGAGLNGVSGIAATGHGVPAQSGVLQVLIIEFENNVNSSPGSVTSCASNNGLTWTKAFSHERTRNSGVGGASNTYVIRHEVWYAYGAVTSGGTFQFTLSGTMDCCCYTYYAFTGADANHPFDLNASLFAPLDQGASGTATINSSTNTNNVLLMAVGAGPGGVNQTEPRFNSLGTRDDGLAENNFSATNTQRFYTVFIHSTTGFSGQVAGWSAALNNSAQANVELYTFAVTADAQVVSTIPQKMLSIF